ncbi:MAG: hypothetical protein ACKV2Q_36620 [Planctomycetaceae bacterium]
MIRKLRDLLSSRKVLVAVAGVCSALANREGPEEVTMTIVALAAAVILGIAIEDAGEKSAGNGHGADSQ